MVAAATRMQIAAQDRSQSGRAGWLEKDLMEARKDLIQLKADLKDEENRTNMFALEVCELTSDKKRLQDENAELVKQLDEARCELGYERTVLARLKYRNLIREAAPPQREHSSTTDRRLVQGE